MERFEKQLSKAYKRFAPLAQSYYYTFSRPSVTVGGTPTVIFLGNHSSGKSSLVNWILGAPTVQDTGVAPTDDGFTGTRMPSTKFSARDTKAYTRRINTSDYFGEYVALNGHNLYQWNGKAKYFDYLD